MRLPSYPREYRHGRYRFPFNRVLVMGIINVTPDSFSDGGVFATSEDAVRRAGELIEQGADILDIGGESTRPGAAPVSSEEEAGRVLPVIKEITRKHPKTPVSIDSCKPEVVRAAIDAGAAMINDVTGLQNPEMVRIAAESQAPVVIMHMKGTPRTMQRRPAYKDVVKEIIAFFKERVRTLQKLGVKRIILDPGIGFGKTANHNLRILNHLEEMTKLGYPIMIGASRKSFMGKILGLPIDQREEATIAVNTLAVSKGAAIIRVHDVMRNHRAIKMAEAILKA